MVLTARTPHAKACSSSGGNRLQRRRAAVMLEKQLLEIWKGGAGGSLGSDVGDRRRHRDGQFLGGFTQAEDTGRDRQPQGRRTRSASESPAVSALVTADDADRCGSILYRGFPTHYRASGRCRAGGVRRVQDFQGRSGGDGAVGSWTHAPGADRGRGPGRLSRNRAAAGGDRPCRQYG